MNKFAALLKLSCMTRAEAADYLGVGEASIAHWHYGRRKCPQGVYDELKAYIQTEMHNDSSKVKALFNQIGEMQA